VIPLAAIVGCSAISGLGGLDFDSESGGSKSTGGPSAGGNGGWNQNGGAATTSTGGSTSSCSDHHHDGDETDVDCGGSCPKCALGKACKTTSDCVADDCVDGFCQPKTPIGIWELRAPTSPPDPRIGCSMGWDGKYVRMLHGRRSGGPGSGRTYLWDGTQWTSTATNPPGGEFGSRSDAAVTISINGMAIFGGYDGTETLDDAWAFTTGGTTWQEFNTELRPPARSNATAAALSLTGILFGGTPSGGLTLDDTWRLEGNAWSQLTPATKPHRRMAATMVTDTARGEILMFGGVDTLNPLADFWIWNGDGDWHQQTGTNPPGRSYAGMAYASARKRTVLFSGAVSRSSNLSDTWEWDGTSWVETSTAAPAIADGCVAYDPNRRRVILFGGQDDQGTYQNSTFEYHVRGDACRDKTTCDTGNCVDSLCCDQAKCGSCERCNDPKSPGVCTACSSCTNGKCD
jgi:hypothetical protein